MILGLFEISNKQMFLQIPSKKGKYTEDFSVDFKGDEGLIRNYILGVFDKVENCDVKYLGKKIEKPPTEEYRYLYLIDRIS